MPIRPSLPLVSEELEANQREGLLVVPDAILVSDLAGLHRETAAICRGDRGDIEGVGPASTDVPDEEALRRYLCIHFPHKIFEAMECYLSHPAISSTLQQLIGPKVKCMQSMLFIIVSGKPCQTWHKDEFFIPMRDYSLNAAWNALDDATQANGCLWVIPGSHLDRLIWPQKEHRDRRFDCIVEVFQFPYKDGDSIPVEMKAGSIVFFNSYRLYRSIPNRAESGYRRVLANRYISAESLLPWFKSPEGVHQGFKNFRDIVMIAGEDPYTWKGLQDRMPPKVWPSGEEGCI